MSIEIMDWFGSPNYFIIQFFFFHMESKLSSLHNQTEYRSEELYSYFWFKKDNIYPCQGISDFIRTFNIQWLSHEMYMLFVFKMTSSNCDKRIRLFTFIQLKIHAPYLVTNFNFDFISFCLVSVTDVLKFSSLLRMKIIMFHYIFVIITVIQNSMDIFFTIFLLPWQVIHGVMIFLLDFLHNGSVK